MNGFVHITQFIASVYVLVVNSIQESLKKTYDMLTCNT